MKEENKNKEKRSFFNAKIIFIILLVILLGVLGYIAYNKISNKPDEASFTRNIRNNNSLVEGNTFSFNGLFCENNSDTECTKSVKVSYNNKNHVIKIKRVKQTTNSTTIFKNTIYIDDKIIDTLDGGTMYNMDNKTTLNFDGYIYVVQDKYLAIVTPFVVEKDTNYVINYYNEFSKLGKGIDIIYGEQKICKKSCSEDSNVLNSLENIEFDGKVFKYWKALCEGRKKEALQIGVTTDGKNVNTKYLDTESNIEIKGACN